MENTRMEMPIKKARKTTVKFRKPLGFWKWKVMLFVAMLVLGIGQVMAADWSGTLASGTYTLTSSGNGFIVNGGSTIYDNIGSISITNGNVVNIIFNTSQTVYVNGTIRVRKGRLNLSIDNSLTGTYPILERKNGYVERFLVLANDTSVATDCCLSIQGNANRQFIVSGGCNGFGVYQDTEGIWRAKYDYVTGVPTTVANYSLIRVWGGVLDLDYVTLEKNWSARGPEEASGGAILVRTGNSPCNITMDYVTMQYNYAEDNGSAMHTCTHQINGQNSSCIMNHCTIYHNYDASIGQYTGATFGSFADNFCTMDLNYCTFDNNYAIASGSGISWNAGCIRPIEINHCTVTNNWGKYGPAVNIVSAANITASTIQNNTSVESAGGIYYTTYNGVYWIDPNIYKPWKGDLTLDENTIIEGNVGRYGAGLTVYVKPIKIGTGNPSTMYMVYQDNEGNDYTVNLNINGAKIRNNEATVISGGGIHMNKSTDNFYEANLNINSGEITGNRAKTHGGGVAVYGLPCNIGSTVGTVTITDNTANIRGGGIYMEDADIIMKSGNIGLENAGNKCEGSGLGGGILILRGNFKMEGGNIAYNTAGNAGGGVYVNNGNVQLEDCTIEHNTSTGWGGGMMVYSDTESSVELLSNSVVQNNTGGGGGGIFVQKGSVLMKGNSSVLNNTSTTYGGGIVIYQGGGINIENGNICGNKALNNDGGGVYVFSNCTFEMSGGKIGEASDGKDVTYSNRAKRGGGVFCLGTFTLNGGSISYNEATTGQGGGVYANSAETITISGANIDYNKASTNGGGVYAMGEGTIIIQNDASVSNNTSNQGGGIYAAADIEFTSGSISNNTATNGGGLFIPACTATLDFTSGTFSGNAATQDGGGIYISEGAVLNLQGVATLTGNHVPATGHGGGIFMNGTLNVGGGTGTQSMKCNDNYAGTSSTINNVYLPSNSKYITLKSDISHQTGGVYDTQMGITVNPEITGGMRPVVYVEDEANEPWLYNLMASISTNNGAVFDDTQHYIAIHTRRNVGAFRTQYIYFHDCWTTVVTSNPGTSHIELVGDVYHIKTAQGLAWFSSLVNGLNHRDGDATSNTFTTPQRNLKAVMDADVDMSANLWVPMGRVMNYDPSSSSFTESTNSTYTGIFDGQGHIISGINNGYLTGIKFYGLFGAIGGSARVMNTFMDSYSYIAANSGTYFMGGIAGAVGGSAIISNCETRGGMDLTQGISEGGQNCNAGGIVGNLGGTAMIHSCMAMPEIEANNTRMGGIVGFMNIGASIKNSFANGDFTRGNAACVIGGIAGINFNTIENCYVRLRGSEPTGFGWFAGTNGGTISYCYAPGTVSNYVNATAGTPTLTGHGNYAATALVGGKYGFAHQDQDVTLASGQSASSNTYIENGHIGNDGELKGLLATLNNWVEAQTDGVAYSTWTRTMASPINDDLPILEFNDFVSAGSTDNVFIAYKDDLNDMIDYANGNTTGGSVYLYDATPTAVNKNTNGNVRVYIAPNVGITQAAGNTLNARVGIALDNSSTGFMAYDWHMFSSALQAAPMGLVYHSDEGTYYVRDNYATLSAQGITHTDYTDVTKMDPPMTTWNTTTGQIGYFPTDAPYGPWRNTGSLSQGFDFYCFHEPSRHWINFKREGRAGFFDHWNQYVYNPATDKHTQIQYTNESAMVSGKGYMVALSQPSMMMADGVLNNTASQSSNASYNEGSSYDHPLRGFNLVGNPYQSYLDFNQFANTNGIDTYYILDADAKGYIAYTTGATPQESEWIGGLKDYTASRYIHPHQGFFVRVDAVQPISFNSDMRLAGTNTNVGGESSSYRDWEPRYALVNMVCTDGEGRNDFATIELDRPEQGGGRKAKGLRSGDASIWFRLGDEDYQIAFAPVGTQSAPLRFEAHADGVYTLRWNMQNADFSYLHLIDNLTGTDIDCLTTDEYRFEAKTSDYTSRFRLVFDFTGIDDPEVPEPVEGPTTFAFMMGDELVINGEGMLQMFDLNGRQLLSTEIHGTQASVAMPKAAAGLYVLRLTDGNQVRTQKMVINK